MDATTTDDRRYVFYSFRHNFMQRAPSSNISERTVEALAGHASEKVTRGYGGGKVEDAALFDAIARIDVSAVDWERVKHAVGRAGLPARDGV